MRLTYRSLVTSALVAGSLFLGAQAASAATSTATLTAGTLTMTAPANFSYPVTELTGLAMPPLSSSFSVTVNGAGTKSGWNLQASIGTLTDAAGDAIPAGGHIIHDAQIAPLAGTTGPTNTIASYGTAIPTTSGVKIFSAAANTGRSESTETFNTLLTIPLDTAEGTYTAALTVSLVAGP